MWATPEHADKLIRAMMEAICTSKMVVYFKETTWHYIPEGCNFHIRCCKNLKSHMLQKFLFFPASNLKTACVNLDGLICVKNGTQHNRSR
jgi:hypothetical protein